jgi:hypothetical protein
MLAAVGQAALADTSPRVRGTIVSATDASITVRTSTGAVETVGLTPKTGYGTSTPGNLNNLTSGEFLGVTSKRVGNRNVALSITIFPESLRGIGEGSYPWDTVPDRGAPGHVGSTMTNGTVTAAPKLTKSTMTNGNVTAAAGTAGTRRLTVTYKGGQQIIYVQASTQVLKLGLATHAVLAPGLSTFLIVQPGATGPVADYVNVGLDGIKLGF